MQNIDVAVQPDHLERISNVSHPVDAVTELIWNGLDADAMNVHIDLEYSPLGGKSLLQTIRVRDDGSGIPYDQAPSFFRNLGGSWKQQKKTSAKGRALHGQAGSGRFRAFALGEIIEWNTTSKSDKGACSYQITARASRRDQFQIGDPKITASRGKSGTVVTISNLVRNFRSLERDKALNPLTEAFALYLREYPQVSIIYDGARIDPQIVERSFSTLQISNIQVTSDKSVDAELVIIEWLKPTDRSLILCDEHGFALSRTPPGIQAPGFQFTAYLKSSYIAELAKGVEGAEGSSLGLQELHPGLRKILDAGKAKLKEYFRLRALEGARDLVETWKREDIYPYKQPAKTLLEVTERQVFDVVALNVHSYLPDFERSDPKNKRFSFELLRRAIEENPSAVQRILSDVIGLPKEKQEELAQLLERTSLTAIINATKLITDRLDMLRGLEILVFDAKEELLERKELHRILAENTWIFGEEYNLSVDDQSLNEVLKKHLELLRKEVPGDTSSVVRSDGTTGIVDLMLSRSIPQTRAIEHEHLIIELKRPKKKIDTVVASQIEGYAFAVAQDERFRDTKTRWIFWVISNEMDDHVRRRSRQKDRPEGILHQDEDFRITIWARTWSQVIGECRARLEFYRGALEYTADRDNSLEYLRRTHAKYLPKNLKGDDSLLVSEEIPDPDSPTESNENSSATLVIDDSSS